MTMPVHIRRFLALTVCLSAMIPVGSRLSAQTAGGGNGPEGVESASGTAVPPVITLWYGKSQTFRKLGVSQRWANILGNVSDPDGVLSLEYSLNGGPAVPVTVGPDNRRLAAAGDFNIDLNFAQLFPLPDSNRVVLTARDNLAEIRLDTVIVKYYNNTLWPATTTIAWKGVNSLTDSAQVVDGLWAQNAIGIHPVRLGYDRLVAIGDTTWGDVEVTVPVTIHSIDSTGYNPNSGVPSVGILMRWAGHTDDPFPGTQPKSGYNPFGALGYYSFYTTGTGERLEIFGNGAVIQAHDNGVKKLQFNVPYYFKINVQTIPSGPYYSFKVWPVGQPEPGIWDLSYQATTADPVRGAVGLVAHHVDASFGPVTVIPTAADVTPPQISALAAAAGRTTAEITWTTDEPATTKIEYGLTTSYGMIFDTTGLRTSHAKVLTGLTENTVYHYRVTTVDGLGNPTVSTDRTFITTGPPVIVSDEFNQGSLDTGVWNFINPLGDAAQSMTGSQVSLAVPGGSAHDPWSSGNLAPRIMQPVNNTDFEIEVKFDSPLNQRYKLSGVIVEQDPSNYIRFDFNSDGSGTRIFAATLINDVPTSMTGFNDVIASNAFSPLYMRIRRERNNWTLSYSLNGTSWTPHVTFKHNLTLTSMGVFAGNTHETPASAPQHTGLVDYFRGRIPATPSLVSPADGAVDVSPSVRLNWTRSVTATSYYVQLGTDSTFVTGLVVSDSTVTDTTMLPGGLVNATTYFWRVQARNSAGTSTFSPRRRFTTVTSAPPAPVAVSPANGAAGVGQPVTLRWRRSSGAAFYRIQLSPDSTFAGGLVVNDSTLTDTLQVVNGLAYSTIYYWRVNARNVGGTSPFSAVQRFTTAIAPPFVPVLVSPVNGVANQPSSVPLVWRRVSTAASYVVQVGTDSAFSGVLVLNDSTVTDTTRTVTGLANSTRYFWRVAARNTGGASGFSVLRSFTTALGSPTLVSPANGSTNQPVTLTFVWNRVSAATGYRLQLGTDSTFQTGLVKNDSTITDTFRVIVGLSTTTRYYWRINARDASGTGPASLVWTLTTGIPLPGQVVLVIPADNEEIRGDSTWLSWQVPAGTVTRYWLDVAADSMFTFVTADSSIGGTATIVRGLLANRTYYWRVRAGNAGGWGPYSLVRRFRTVLTGVTDNRPLPTSFVLSQNYPNPFNPSTAIEFGLPGESEVRLEVFDLLGRRVALLVSGKRQAGYHVEHFDAAGQPTGIYVARLTAGETTLIRKMMLLK